MGAHYTYEALTQCEGGRINPDIARIVNMIRTDRAHTRADISRQTGIGRNAISSHLATAIEIGLIELSGRAPSNGGRSPHMWRFVGGAGNVLTACIGVRLFHACLTDLTGEVLDSITQPWSLHEGPESTLTVVCEALHALSNRSSVPIWGVGISLPGPINHATGRPVQPPIMAGWHDFDVSGFIGERMGAPVLVDNDVNAMALGSSVRSGVDDVIYVQMGSGIGAGVLTHGTLHRGAQGAAGDIGHTRIVGYDTVICRCGRVNCLEAVAGGWALERSALKLAADGLSPFLSTVRTTHGTIELEDIAAGANAGDTSCIELVATAATNIGAVLAVLVSFFNPHKIIMAGPIPEGSQLFQDTVIRTIDKQALLLATQVLTIEIASSARDDGTRGCALMVVDEAFRHASE